jgi:hypothetical protein
MLKVNNYLKINSLASFKNNTISSGEKDNIVGMNKLMFVKSKSILIFFTSKQNDRFIYFYFSISPFPETLPSTSKVTLAIFQSK